MVIGILGGSGLYNLNEVDNQPREVTTPIGAPAGPYFTRRAGENTLYFLARHGQGHRFSPSDINYRANIFGFKSLGVEAIISISAVGSLKKELEPGHFVLPDQYLDMTRGTRARTFFDSGMVAHAHFADPACKNLSRWINEGCGKLSLPTIRYWRCRCGPSRTWAFQ